MDDDERLQRKLRRLGVVKGFHNLKSGSSRRPKPDRRPEPDLRPRPPTGPLPGEELETEHGSVWIARRRYPADYRHGRHVLRDAASVVAPETLTLLGEADLGERPAFLDTETTGLAGGAGTLVFLTGVGIWTERGVELHQVFLRDPAEEKAAMRYLAELLDSVTSLVTFNGGPFDLPLLESRFILQRLVPRWRALPHLDLLVVARLLWRDHLPSRRLGYLEEAVLDIQRTGEDIPGWMIPSVYRTYLRTGETEEIARIFYHNEIDILSLVTLLTHAGRLVTEPETLEAEAGEWVGLGRIYERAGSTPEAEEAWQRALEADTLPPDVAARLWRELGLCRKRSEAWDAALEIWSTWAARQPRAIEPLVERAKYFEWVEKDLTAALKETEEALQRVDGIPNRLKRRRTRAELEHRRDRLCRKLHID